MKVRVEPEVCVGHGRCYELSPDVFGEDERGRCLIEREEVPPDLMQQARAGASACPEKAITILEDSPSREPD